MTAGSQSEWAEHLVREHCFGSTGPTTNGPPTFGAELELLALDRETHTVAPINGSTDRRGSLDVVRDVAPLLGWRETISDKGISRFVSESGGALTFEPGGQLEYASAVHHSVDALLAELSIVEARLRESADARGIELLAVGVDPFNGPGAAPLQLTAERYSRMAQYFAGIGPDGARMMRQTASLQVNIGGVSVEDRWQSANALAPWLVALFANSSQYAGASTGYASYRAQTWRGVDPSRTGLFAGDNAVAEYSAFALAANAFLADDAGRPFRELDSHLATESAFGVHLSTLFPEVRPRGYLELRSLDAGDDDHRRAALVLVAGALADARASGEVRMLLGAADDTLLRDAGRNGGYDARIAARAPDLVRIALSGCARLGTSVISRDAVDRAADTLSRLLASTPVALPDIAERA